MKLNYQLELDKVLDSIDKNQKPSLLLHSCCAPCSSYVLEYLSSYFNITIIYYNPNIDEEDEFNKRVKELEKLIKLMNLSIKVINNGHRHEDFKEISSGLEDEPEGGKRCFKCYRLRLLESVLYAKENNFDYFCTTLSISPFKNASKLNEIGFEFEKEYGVKYLISDFKKKNGYKRSIELSHIYNLYRQDYCGCIYSKIERDKKKKEYENV